MSLLSGRDTSPKEPCGLCNQWCTLPTWSATEWKQLYAKYFNENFLYDQSNPKIWEAIYNVPDEEIWKTRVTMKNKLVDYIRKQFRETWLKNQGDPSRIVSLLDKINPNALLIGFGRRFATYKRAHLLFTDLERLSKIVNNPDYPVQFLFTGKAHPHDGAGQGLIKRIVEISQRPNSWVRSSSLKTTIAVGPSSGDRS